MILKRSVVGLTVLYIICNIYIYNRDSYSYKRATEIQTVKAYF